LKRAILLVSALLAACNEPDERKDVPPPYVLEERRFVELLTDLALAESATNLNVRNTTFEKMDSVYAFTPLKDHGVTKETLDSTIAYYSRNPKLYKTVYDSVLLRLDEIKKKYVSPAQPAENGK
jgi:hypothetical protein